MSSFEFAKICKEMSNLSETGKLNQLII